MGDKVLLTVEERQLLGKKVKRLRKEGLVPAVIYGQGVEPRAVMADVQMAEKAWREAGKHQPVELTLGGQKRLVMIKSADVDPVKHRLRHLSLHAVKQNEKVETEVPVKIANEGETVAEKAGLVILQTIETVDIEALPRDLPEFVELDSSKLAAAGDHATVADIKPIQGVTVTSDPDQIVASVYEPSALVAQNDALAGEATEETEVEAENGEAAATEEEQGKVPKAE